MHIAVDDTITYCHRSRSEHGCGEESIGRGEQENAKVHEAVGHLAGQQPEWHGRQSHECYGGRWGKQWRGRRRRFKCIVTFSIRSKFRRKALDNEMHAQYNLFINIAFGYSINNIFSMYNYH